MSNQDIQNGTAAWEAELDLIHPEARARAMAAFDQHADRLAEVAPTRLVPGNLHAHTFYSFNCYGYSPTRFALLAKRHGMEVAGIVDFDVLDALDEFHGAGRRLNLKTVVSLETRVYVPEFSTRVINSPGEPGVAYHMAIGFARPPSDLPSRHFLADLRARSSQRNRTIVDKVNAFLKPVQVDYATDVIPLTPNGNATERHLVQAYARQAAGTLNAEELLAYWTSKLGPGLGVADVPDSPKLMNLIRAKTMKQGGPGYAQPDTNSFPTLADVNYFALACGALPTVAWLDGTSPGEQAMHELCRVAAHSGACALNLIPDRNFTPGVQDQKLKNLHEVMALAEQLQWPVIAGTEMNSPGQKFVDQFDAEELRPLVPAFQRGAFILYGHTALQRAAGLGYVSPWAERHLVRREDRNAFYETLGRTLTPATEDKLAGLDENASPDTIAKRLH
jgi:hypothetical protein